MATQITLPKDSEGHEISLDTNVLYDRLGNPREVMRFAYSVQKNSEKWYVIFVDNIENLASEMLLNPPAPDSFDKLLEDLDRAAKNTDASHTVACAYINHCVNTCYDCKFYKQRSCVRGMCVDIADRIRNIRNEN